MSDERGELEKAWAEGYAAGMRREFEVLAHIKGGEPSPEAPISPFTHNDTDRRAS